MLCYLGLSHLVGSLKNNEPKGGRQAGSKCLVLITPMSTPEQRKRLKEYYQRGNALFAEWRERGYQYPPPSSEPMPDDLRRLQCGAKTIAGTPCKQIAIYSNGRCKWNGGCRTGPKTEAGKRRAALNGNRPKQKRSHTSR